MVALSPVKSIDDSKKVSSPSPGKMARTSPSKGTNALRTKPENASSPQRTSVFTSRLPAPVKNSSAVSRRGLLPPGNLKKHEEEEKEAAKEKEKEKKRTLPSPATLQRVSLAGR
jgi:hypothetical protein